jgi:hypothetical protein
VSGEDKDELYFRCFVVALTTAVVLEAVAWFDYLWRLITEATG